MGQGAEEILKAGAKHFEFTGEELRQNRRGAWRRSSVAWAIARETSVLQEWIAERLNLKFAANASQQIRRFYQVPDKELPQEELSWKLSRNVA